MKKFFLPISGLALLWSIPFLGQAPAAAIGRRRNVLRQRRAASRAATAVPIAAANLFPQCHVYCTTKKVTTYKYTCICEYICVPGVTRLCDKCSDDGGQDCCKCRLHMVRKLVKIPCVEEVPVRNARCSGSARFAATSTAAWKPRPRSRPRPCLCPRRRRPRRLSRPPDCCPPSKAVGGRRLRENGRRTAGWHPPAIPPASRRLYVRRVVVCDHASSGAWLQATTLPSFAPSGAWLQATTLRPTAVGFTRRDRPATRRRSGPRDTRTAGPRCPPGRATGCRPVGKYRDRVGTMPERRERPPAPSARASLALLCRLTGHRQSLDVGDNRRPP